MADLVKARPFALTTIRAILSQVEAHLTSSSNASSRAGFLFGGDRPSYADLSLYFPLAWSYALHSGPAGKGNAFSQEQIIKGLFGDTKTFPKTLAWFQIFSKHIEAEKKAQGWKHILGSARISGETAAEAIKKQSTQGAAAAAKKMELNPNDPIVQAGWVKQIGQPVTVTPTDTGKIPQIGTLVALAGNRVTIRVEKSGVLAHFPRLDYVVMPHRAAKA